MEENTQTQATVSVKISENNNELIHIGDVRKRFNLVELYEEIDKKKDILHLSRKLNIKPRILNLAVCEGRIKKIMPQIQHSKADILSHLRTDREIKLFLKDNNISARDLRRMVIGWKNEIQENPLKLITKEEHDLIIGSLLGDASIRQRDLNCCFRVSHSFAQRDYITWKLSVLSNFVMSEFSETTRQINGRVANMVNLSTKTHQLFNYYRRLFYKNGRKIISKQILDFLTPRSLAIWICDDGSFSRTQRYITLCTNSFTLAEHKLIKKELMRKFNLDPTIGFRDNKYYYLRFRKNDTQKLIEIIKPFIPESMKYKIGE